MLLLIISIFIFIKITRIFESFYHEKFQCYVDNLPIVTMRVCVCITLVLLKCIVHCNVQSLREVDYLSHNVPLVS